MVLIVRGPTFSYVLTWLSVRVRMCVLAFFALIRLASLWIFSLSLQQNTSLTMPLPCLLLECLSWVGFYIVMNPNSSQSWVRTICFSQLIDTHAGEELCDFRCHSLALVGNHNSLLHRRLSGLFLLRLRARRSRLCFMACHPRVWRYSW